jgi:hypothetical protein
MAGKGKRQGRTEVEGKKPELAEAGEAFWLAEGNACVHYATNLHRWYGLCSMAARVTEGEAAWRPLTS